MNINFRKDFDIFKIEIQENVIFSIKKNGFLHSEIRFLIAIVIKYGMKQTKYKTKIGKEICSVGQ